MTFTIRPYRADDFDAVYALWQSTMSANWQLSPAYLRRMIDGYERYREGDHSIAEQNGQIIGFVATKIDAAGTDAGIHLLMVDPAHQRQGIGRALHQDAMARIKNAAVLNLAHGGGEPFFPGVPHNQPGAIEFFQACGWEFPDVNYDLTRDLSDYLTPPGVIERATRQGIIFHPAQNAAEAAAVIAFERRMFPFWAEFFEGTAETGGYNDIMAAWDGETVVGSLLMSKSDIAGLNPDGLWHQILGDDMGGIGAVGVDEVRQGNGIGLAMVAAASENVQARGVRNCIIGWTDLLDFYGKLGYTPWRAYGMTDR